MGGSSIGYLLREGARNIYANKQMSVAAIGVLVACMLLIGASIVFSFNANSFVGYVEAQNEVVVFLKDNLSDDRISEVEQQLKNTENVSAVRFISKEEGLDSWVQSMSGVAENSEELFAPLYKTAAIALVVRAGGGLCRDAGESALAAVLETAGTVCALLAALPLMRAVLELLVELMG